MKKYQIGVIGTSADIKLDKRLIVLAKELGKEIAISGHTLFFGAEQDRDSLSSQAAKVARENGGTAVAVTYGSHGNIFDKTSADYLIRTGSERGGPRESVLIMSCDGVIAVSGGSGTMTEMLIAYMNNIPIVVIKNTGGWSNKMADNFFDHRKRMKAVSAKNPREAVAKIIELVSNKNV